MLPSRPNLSTSSTNNARPASTIWLVDGRTVDDAELARDAAWLNADEAARYGRFVQPLRQRQFLIGRVLLRRALGWLLNVPVGAISLTERPGLAPLLDHVEPAPGFSLSHSGPWVACAVCAQSALGLDIEVMDAQRDLHALAEQAFNAEEKRWFAKQSNRTRVAAFYQLWSSKEARIKLAANSASTCEGSQLILPHPSISMVLCSALQTEAMLMHDAFGSLPLAARPA